MKLFCAPCLVQLAAGLAFVCQGSESASKPPFEFRDGDRVALVGDTLVEREPIYGAIEQRLVVEFPERNVTFRNLGWSADTPDGISRAGFDFDKPGKGFEHLTNQIAAVKPTVVILGYGMADSFAGEAGVPGFKSQMRRLMDATQSLDTNTAVRFILLSPIRHEKLPPSLPDPAPHNHQLALYAEAIRELAAERRCEFVSLFDVTNRTSKATPLTDNGIHLDAAGYDHAAEAIANALRWNKLGGISYDGANGSGGRGHVEFTAIADRLDAKPIVRVGSLRSGQYELRVDGVSVCTASAGEWRRGVTLERGPILDQAERLRQAIARKNQLYFDRWRPQNDTYLFGFRKHEQGQNAKEIPQFDPLIAAEEKKIAELCKPVAHRFELVRVTDSARSTRSQRAQTEIRIPKSETRNSQSLITPTATNSQPLPNFDVAPGFEVSLFAENPLLAKPIQMNFDPQGRLWIASSTVYPQIQPGQVADDKILVLEDTNRDGKADKSTVFADGLLIPSGVAPGDGGAYVGQSTDLLFFRDTNGDGKADERRIVLSAFGTEDTHHMVHTLHWGHDGRLYFNQSIYIHTHIETPSGVRRLNSGGVWQFRPGPMQLDVLLRGFCNPWGHQFDAFGQSFITDGAGYQGISFGIPGATYFTYADMRREMKSISPGSYPKYCGLEIIRSSHFPADWQGNAVTCDFRAHRIVRFGIEERGAGYAAKEMPELLRSTNASFRPIDLKLGPDGALYIADWSNPIINHGEVDFRDPRRDHEHGRIWRITANGRPLAPKPQLVNASNRTLLDELLSRNLFNQQQARRVLTERGGKTQSDLGRWTRAATNDEARLQGLWMYQSLDVVEPGLLKKLLTAKDGRIRAAAVRVAGDWIPRLKSPLALLAPFVRDQHPRVRLEAVRAIARIPQARVAELVLSALDQRMDDFLDYAVWLSINDLAEPWIAAVKSGAWQADGRETQLEFALKAIPPAQVSEVFRQFLSQRTLVRDGRGPWIELIGTAGGEKELRRLFDQVVQNGFDAAATVRALKSLNEAARLRQMKPSGNLAALNLLFLESNEEIRTEAFRLAGRWKLEGAVQDLSDAAHGRRFSIELRCAAVEALREIGGEKVIADLELLAGKKSEPQLRRQTVLALAALDFDRAKVPLLNVLTNVSNETNARPLSLSEREKVAKPGEVLFGFWRSLLTIQGAATNVARILPRTDLPVATAKAGLRAAREGGRNEPELVWALSRAANLQTEAETLSTAELQELAKQVQRDGDAPRGEKIYRRSELSCVTCHAIGGTGGKVGPDLASIGASAPLDYIIESVLYPNRKVKEGFHSVLIETKDSEAFTGILVSEAGEQIVLRDATGKDISVAKATVMDRRTVGSLMPSGLLDGLTPVERLDLFRYLGELGKPGPYDATKPSNVGQNGK